MIELIKSLPSNTVGAVYSGHISRADYEKVLIPAVEAAIRANKKVRVYIEIRSFNGMDAGAMLDDFMVGTRHLTQWERIALVSDVDWIKHAVKAFAFLFHGELKLFPLAEADAARNWITESAS